MFAEFDVRSLRDIPEGRERDAASWRGVVSAWALVVLIVLAFTGLQAAALLGPAGRSADPLTGAIIPQHDPACAAPLISSDRVPSHCRLPTNPADQRDWLLTPGT
jgi:uncharacterized iron-regulated membrane protein